MALTGLTSPQEDDGSDAEEGFPEDKRMSSWDAGSKEGAEECLVLTSVTGMLGLSPFLSS